MKTNLIIKIIILSYTWKTKCAMVINQTSIDSDSVYNEYIVKLPVCLVSSHFNPANEIQQQRKAVWRRGEDLAKLITQTLLPIHQMWHHLHHLQGK